MGKQYTFNPARLPGWLLIDLDNAGIPLSFDEDALTRDQCRMLSLLDHIFELVEAGELRPEVRDGEVRYHLTSGHVSCGAGTEDDDE